MMSMTGLGVDGRLGFKSPSEDVREIQRVSLQKISSTEMRRGWEEN